MKMPARGRVNPHTAYIGIGSNLGDRLHHCKLAIQTIDHEPHIQVSKISSWIETKPIGYTRQNNFINGVIEIKTTLSPLLLLKTLKSIEEQAGRKKNFKWGPRVIDLDILLYDDISMKTTELTIPHPEIHNRAFIRDHLLEINPQLKLVFNKPRDRKGR